jgi:hypothetical protein
MKMTTVRVGLKFVRNLGNYESVHIDVGVEDEVRQGETVGQATDRVYTFVESKLAEKVKQVTEDLRD